MSRLFRYSKSFNGNTIAKKRSIVTDNVARTDPNRNVFVSP